jgi:hypothetical protein
VKKVTTIALIVVALAIIICIAVALQASSRRLRAAAIKLGDTKAQVERQLGRATMVTSFSPLWRTNAAAALFCDTAETWAYGSLLDFHSEFPWFRLRFFLPDPDDIAVEFSTSGRVIRVTVPQTKS